MGSGKSTVSNMFVDNGVPVWDADEEVHKTYKNGGSGYSALVSLYPKLESDKGIDRGLLTNMIKNKEVTLRELEKLIHPILSFNRYSFINRNSDKAIIGFDIPLLFQTKADLWLDSVLMVSCSKRTQMVRLLKRPTMTKEKLRILLSRQGQVSHKEERCEFIIDSEKELEEMKEDVIKVIKSIKMKL